MSLLKKPIVKKLKNGIPVLLAPQKGAVSMTLEVFVHVGSRYETKEQNGASHFIEHMMFKGTKRRPNTLAISQILDQYGAEYNAFTSKEMTAYYIKMDAEKTELAIDLLNDMLFHSKYEPAEMDRERGVIVEEINMYEDNPQSQMGNALEEALFPESSLGWNIAGPREVIRGISREALVAYRDAYYVPSRITIALAGRIMPSALASLEKTFGKRVEPKTPQDVSFTPFVAPETKESLSLAFHPKKIEQVQFGMAFHGFPVGSEESPAVGLLSVILGGTMSSRLFTEVRERRGLCYSIQCAHQSYQDTGIFDIAAGLEKNCLTEATKVIWKELDKLTKTPVSSQELRRAKDHLRGKLALAFEDSANQADWYGKQWVFQGKLATPEERLKKIEAVTPKQVQAVAKRLFSSGKWSASVVGPFTDADQVRKLLTSARKS